MVGRALTAYRIEWLSEAGVALLLGVFTGAVARAASISSTYLSWLSFKAGLLSFLPLPPPLSLPQARRLYSLSLGVEGRARRILSWQQSPFV